MRKFDFIVIRSGSGLEVSADLSDAGWAVAIVEEGPLHLPKPGLHSVQDASTAPTSC